MNRSGDVTTLPPGTGRRPRPAPDGNGRKPRAAASPAVRNRTRGRQLPEEPLAAGAGLRAGRGTGGGPGRGTGLRPGRGPGLRRPAAEELPRAAAGTGRTAAPARPARRRQAGAGSAAPPRARRSGEPGTRTRRRPLGPAARPWPPGAGQPRRPAGQPDQPGPQSRTRFVFLVIGLLGGGLISLLVINTILATGALQITELQKANVQIAQRSQVLQAQIATEQTPAGLYQRARRLGMVEPPLTHFLELKKGRIVSQPSHVPGVVYNPPGYTP